MNRRPKYPVYSEYSGRKCEPPPYEVLRPYDITADNLQDKIIEAMRDYSMYDRADDPKWVRADLVSRGFPKNAVSGDDVDLFHHVRNRHEFILDAGWRRLETPQGMDREIFNKYRKYISEAWLWKATFINVMDNRGAGGQILDLWKRALLEFIDFYRSLESVGGGH